MAHYAILCPADAGHILPLGTLANELVRRGHRITMISRPKAAAMMEQMNLPMLPMDPERVPCPRSDLLWMTFGLIGATSTIGMRNGFRWDAELGLQQIPTMLQDLAVDGVIMDQIVPAGGTIAERLGLPFVTVCTATPWNEEVFVPPPYTSWAHAEGAVARWRNRVGYLGWHWFFWPAMAVVNRYRKAWNLSRFKRIDETFSPLAQITQLIPEMDFPRRELPDTFHYVGSLAAGRCENSPPFPWDRLDGRPLVFASLGTVADPVNRPVYPKIAQACAGIEAQLVLALGKWNDKDKRDDDVGNLPGDPLVVDFAPQLALLDRAAVMITHAGMNTMMEAISRGVPMVAMPRSADQPANGARIEHSGAGLRASFHRSSADDLRRVIQRVLTDDQFRRRAQELQQAMLAAGGVGRAAEIVEQALTTGRPVARK